MNFDMTYCSGKRCPDLLKGQCLRSTERVREYMDKQGIASLERNISVSDWSDDHKTAILPRTSAKLPLSKAFNEVGSKICQAFTPREVR